VPTWVAAQDRKRPAHAVSSMIGTALIFAAPLL
jgi:hypothetical protein